jgi:hypothetical protein
VQIILNISLDKDLEAKYIALFKDNKNLFIKYDMLKIISKIDNNENIDIDNWLDKYKEQNLNSWSFDELENWANKKESPKKEKLLEAIEVFKSKVDK